MGKKRPSLSAIQIVILHKEGLSFLKNYQLIDSFSEIFLSERPSLCKITIWPRWMADNDGFFPIIRQIQLQKKER